MQPARVKHTKVHKGKLKDKATRGTYLSFGSYGLKAMGTKWITARQLEASRRHIIRYMKKGGKLWVRIFPDKPVTSKGEEVPLGGGKGAVHHYVYPIKPGRIIFEIDGLKEDIARQALKGAGMKLPIKTKFVKRDI